MDITEAYIFLFTDSFVSGLVLPAKQSLVFPAMRIFGGYNLYYAGIIATFGITLAAFPNWFFGRMLLSLKRNMKEKEPGPRLEKIISYLHQYGYWLGLFGFIPVLGPILTVFSGLVRTSILKITMLIFTVNIIYYTLLVY